MQVRTAANLDADHQTSDEQNQQYQPQADHTDRMQMIQSAAQGKPKSEPQWKRNQNDPRKIPSGNAGLGSNRFHNNDEVKLERNKLVSLLPEIKI